MSWASEIRRFVSRIQALVDRNRHRCVVDVPEYRIASFVGRPGLLAVSGFVGQLADSSQVLQDLLNNITILYRCNDPDGPTTLRLAVSKNKHPFSTFRKVSSSLGVAFYTLFRAALSTS
jgi:hypothetical protein